MELDKKKRKNPAELKYATSNLKYENLYLYLQIVKKVENICNIVTKLSSNKIFVK